MAVLERAEQAGDLDHSPRLDVTFAGLGHDGAVAQSDASGPQPRFKPASSVFEFRSLPGAIYRNRTDDPRITRGSLPRSLASPALAAPITREIALTALAALGLSKDRSTNRSTPAAITSPRPVHRAYAPSRADKHARPSPGPRVTGHCHLAGLLTYGCRPDSASAAHHEIPRA